ncbi:MAG: ROK family protein [Cellulomonadaceae bacterium]
MLRFAWEHGVFTSTDAMSVGLTRATTIDAIDELIDRGLLRELENARAGGDYQRGRPARRFELRADAAVVLGTDAGQSHITTVVADLRGTTLARRSIDVSADTDEPTHRREVLLASVDDALAAAGTTRAQVLAVCVGVTAPVDAEGRSPAHRQGFWRRRNPDLRGAFAPWAPIVRVDNDASLAAVAEGHLGAACGAASYITLLAGDRLGAGVVVDGHLLRGAHGGVGEVVAFEHVLGVGSAEGLGHRLAAAAREAAGQGVLPAGHPWTTLPPAEITGELVIRAARTGDPHAQAILEQAGATLARIAGLLGSLFDPERIVVSGAIAENAQEMIDVARRLLPGELHLPAPELVPSTLGAEVVATGAVVAALDAARDGVLALERWHR